MSKRLTGKRIAEGSSVFNNVSFKVHHYPLQTIYQATSFR
jgi:hypothetical protein